MASSRRLSTPEGEEGSDTDIEGRNLHERLSDLMMEGEPPQGVYKRSRVRTYSRTEVEEDVTPPELGSSQYRGSYTVSGNRPSRRSVGMDRGHRPSHTISQLPDENASYPVIMELVSESDTDREMEEEQRGSLRSAHRQFDRSVPEHMGSHRRTRRRSSERDSYSEFEPQVITGTYRQRESRPSAGRSFRMPTVEERDDLSLVDGDRVTYRKKESRGDSYRQSERATLDQSHLGTHPGERQRFKTSEEGGPEYRTGYRDSDVSRGRGSYTFLEDDTEERSSLRPTLAEHVRSYRSRQSEDKSAGSQREARRGYVPSEVGVRRTVDGRNVIATRSSALEEGSDVIGERSTSRLSLLDDRDLPGIPRRDHEHTENGRSRESEDIQPSFHGNRGTQDGHVRNVVPPSAPRQSKAPESKNGARTRTISSPPLHGAPASSLDVEPPFSIVDGERSSLHSASKAKIPQETLELPRTSEWMFTSQHSMFRGSQTRDSTWKSSEKNGYSLLRDDDEYGEETRVRHTPSTILPELQEPQRRFFSLVSSGDVEAVRLFLQKHQPFDINCHNYQGLSALYLSVQNSHEEMIRFLLCQPGITVGDCALHAVKDDKPDILAVLLDHLRSINPELEYSCCYNSAVFPDGTTPLLLAAQYGFYEMIGLLLKRGHVIPRPHPVGCMCPEFCQPQRTAEDILKTAMMRLDLYRAVTNPAFLCHSSEDPILTAFELHRELKQWARVNTEFRGSYLSLADDVLQFSVDLIDCCRSSKEVEAILRRKEGSNFPGYAKFPRLMLAMDYNQKQFVAHPKTQQVLDYAWHGDWYQWKHRSDIAKVITVFPRTVMLPVIAIMCMVMPHHRWVKHWQLPINKLINSVASYIIFLVLVFLECNISKKNQRRGPPNSGLEPVLVLFVASYIWRSIRLCIIQGTRRFITVSSNWYDAIWQLLFCLTFLFWFAAAIDVLNNGQRDLERKYWHHLDPTLIAEGFLSLASIMAFSRLLLFLQLNYHLGPLQVSLGKMVKDIGKFVVLIFMIMLAFAAGLCRMYEYYDGMVQEDTTTGNKVTQVSSFVNFEKTMKTLFWAIFCMSPVESADVVISNLPGPTEGTTVVNEHKFTEAIGHICFAVYESVMVVIILNMLIATICNTFQKVTDNVDVEWMFGRTATCLMYMSQTTLPPPFNLIPTASGMGSMVDWCKNFVRPTAGKKAHFSLAHCCYVEEEEHEDEQDFTILMAQLVQRYFRKLEPDTQKENSRRTTYEAPCDA